MDKLSAEQLEDLADDIRQSMCADDRQSSDKLSAGFTALGSLSAEIDRLRAEIERLEGELRAAQAGGVAALTQTVRIRDEQLQASTAQVERLREALKRISEWSPWEGYKYTVREMRAFALAALSESPKESPSPYDLEAMHKNAKES